MIEKQQFLNYDIKDNSVYGERGYKMSSEKFKNLPKFSFAPPPLLELLKDNQQNLLFLFFGLQSPFIGLPSNLQKNLIYVFNHSYLRT